MLGFDEAFTEASEFDPHYFFLYSRRQCSKDFVLWFLQIYFHVFCIFPGAAKKSAKHGTADKTQSIIVSMKNRMENRASERPEIFQQIR